MPPSKNGIFIPLVAAIIVVLLLAGIPMWSNGWGQFNRSTPLQLDTFSNPSAFLAERAGHVWSVEVAPPVGWAWDWRITPSRDLRRQTTSWGSSRARFLQIPYLVINVDNPENTTARIRTGVPLRWLTADFDSKVSYTEPSALSISNRSMVFRVAPSVLRKDGDNVYVEEIADSPLFITYLSLADKPRWHISATAIITNILVVYAVFVFCWFLYVGGISFCRVARGRCAGCGYQLGGLPSNQAACPECGRSL